MQVFILVKVDFGHKENIAVCTTEDKARAIKIGFELDALESGDVCGITYHIEENVLV